MLRLWVRIPPGAWIFFCCECCVLSGRSLCDWLITHPEESYGLWCVVVCDLETSLKRKPWPTGGQSRQNKQLFIQEYIQSSWTVLVKRNLLTLYFKFLHHLQSIPLLHEYSGPSDSAMLESIPGSPFLVLCQVPAAIHLESLQWCRIFTLHQKLQLWEEEKVTGGQIGWVWGMGDHCHVVLGLNLRKH